MFSASLGFQPCPVYILCALSLVSLLVYYRGDIDRWALSRLGRPADGLATRLFFFRLQKENKQGRKLWMGSVSIFTACLWRNIDHFGMVWCLITIPLALATYKHGVNTRLGWLHPVLQHCWTVARLLLPNSQVDIGTRLFFLCLCHATWQEVSMENLSSLMLNHLITNLIVIPFLLTQSSLWFISPLVSMAMLFLFCYRRSSPPERCESTHRGFYLLTSRCAELVRLVLESGDELCEDNRALLGQVSMLLKGQDCPDCEPQTTSCNKESCQSASCMSVRAVNNTITTDLMSAEGLGVGGGTGVQGDAQGGPPEHWGVDIDQHLTELGASLVDPAAVASIPSRNWILDSCCDELRGSQPEHSEASHHKRQRPTDGFMQQTSKLQNELQYPDELVHMSFDAMAQVHLASGSVTWSNDAFKSITHTAGGGDATLGIECLQGHFLQQVPTTLQTKNARVGAGAVAQSLTSATKVVGPKGDETLLWAIRQQLPATSDDSSGCAACAPPSPDSGEETPTSAVEEFPAAELYPDPHTRVMRSTGKGKCQRAMLWAMYGSKGVLGSVDGVVSETRTLERLYYKCTQKDCKARLKIDVTLPSRERVNVDPSGRHNHYIQLVHPTTR